MWNLLPDARRIATFQLDEKPELLHIVKLGCTDLYVCFYEDAYQQEPWQTGLRVMTEEEILEKFKIEL